ncbi:tetratricopeptide repeat protein [Shewanella algidipiscicola]|uniref:tetratricopeptide repeat protein n=1 Tax=Shewanella algidipiscicola TaxID=614070 RepID=UPI000D7831EE|nr:DUF2225 domain-containing protein [Shewanella algidipiscicola]
MRAFFYCLLVPAFLYCSVATAAYSQLQLVSQEVKLRETPSQLFQEMMQSLNFDLSFNNDTEFRQIAHEHGFDAEELEEQLQWLARIYLESDLGENASISKASAIITSLETIADTPYDMSKLYMLKARKIGREKQDYQQAIALYTQALNQLDSSEDVRTVLLRHNIHHQLGDLYRITLHTAQAQFHLNQYRQLAYQLNNDYLSANAEAALGKFYTKNEQFNKALQHYTQAIRRSENINQPFLNAILSLRLARVYRELQSWDEALQYAHKAADGFKALNNNNYLSSCMTAIAIVYAEQGLWNQAIDYYLNAQQIDVKSGNLTAQALNFHNLGEAYFNNNEAQTALDFLIKANSLFLQKKSKHYLVYNDLLIAQVASSIEDWHMVNNYAAKAFVLAKEKSLLEQMVEALRYRTQAFIALGDTEKAHNALTQLLDLSDELNQQANEKPESNENSLAEQKLVLQLSQLKTTSNIQQQQSAQFKTALVISLVLAAILLLTCIYQWRSKQQISLRKGALKKRLTNEPVSEINGYRGLTESLSQADKLAMVGLISLTNKHNIDIQWGVDAYQQVMLKFMSQLDLQLECDSYLIRPGVLAITLKQSIAPMMLLGDIRRVLETQPKLNDAQLHLGILSLPLLQDPDIKLEPNIYFNVLQMMVAGAISLGHNKDYFVSIIPLSFAPVAIFSPPLYSHLEKGISRGLVKVECNDDKTLIRWPSDHITID